MQVFQNVAEIRKERGSWRRDLGLDDSRWPDGGSSLVTARGGRIRRAALGRGRTRPVAALDEAGSDAWTWAKEGGGA